MNNPLLFYGSLLAAAALSATVWLGLQDLLSGRKFRLDPLSNKQPYFLTSGAIWFRFSVKVSLFGYILSIGIFQYRSLALVVISLVALATSIIVLTLTLRKLKIVNKETNGEISHEK